MQDFLDQSSGGDPEDLSVVAEQGSRQSIAKIGYSHDAMINLLIARSGRISQNELAEYFGYTASWISQVMSSDAFQARYAERTKELIDPAIRDAAAAGFKDVLNRSIEILKEKLAAPKISDQLAIQSATLASRALGYGAREQTVINHTNMDIHLEELGGRLTTLLTRKKSEVLTHIDKLTQES